MRIWNLPIFLWVGLAGTIFFVPQVQSCPTVTNITINPSIFCINSSAEATIIAVPIGDDWPWDANKTWKYRITKGTYTNEGDSTQGSVTISGSSLDGPGVYEIRAKAMGQKDGNTGWKTDWSEKSATFTILKVEFGAGFDRVAPTKTQTVSIVTFPSPLPSGVSASISAVRTYGAEGSVNLSPSPITCSTNVNVVGVQQSWDSGVNAAPTNMVLMAQLLGSTFTNDDRFTVCAHVCTVTNYFIENYGENAILVGFGWASDSGNLADLNESLVREQVTYPSSPVPAPFQAWGPTNPFVKPSEGGYNGTEGSGIWSDLHSYPPGLAAIAANPVVGSFDADQWYQSKCKRCGSNWENEENYIIRRETLAPNGGDPRRYRITKTGVGLSTNATRTVNIP